MALVAVGSAGWETSRYPSNFPVFPPFPHYEKRALPRTRRAAPITMSKITKEAVLLLSLFLIAAMVQFFAESLPMALCLYFLPTMYSAYYFGRRHATLTAFASVFLVFLLRFVNNLVPSHPALTLPGERLFNLAIWAGVLAVTGYAMGSLYERAQGMTSDLRESFGGLLLVLQHFIASQKHTNSETQRVVDAAVKIADAMRLGSDRVELVRSAVLLRDLSKLGISNDILYKAADVTHDELVASFRKRHKSDPRAQAIGNSIRRVLPIIVAEQILLAQGARAVNVPIEAHILAVADAYQKMTSGSSGKALSPEQAEQEIRAGSGERFNPGVVDAFVKAFGERALGANA